MCESLRMVVQAEILIEAGGVPRELNVTDYKASLDGTIYQQLCVPNVSVVFPD